MKKIKIPALIACLSLTAIAISFFVILGRMNLVPARYVVLGAVGAAAVILGTTLLLWKFGKNIRTLVGLILAVIVAIVMIFGIAQLKKIDRTMEKMTTVSETKVSQMSIYVRKEDEAHAVEDLRGRTFGVLKDQDQAATEKALEDLQTQLGQLDGAVDVTGYDSPMLLVKGLADGEVDAILMNVSLFEVLKEQSAALEDNSLEKIRELSSMDVEVTMTYTKPAEEDKAKEKGKDSEKDVKEEGEELPEVITIYVTGIDTYGKIENTARSDVNIIVSVNTRTHQILLLSTPRDFYVPLSISNGREDKLTHAGIYGVDCSLETLEMLYDTEIDYFFRVNFSGFQEIIDALGGVMLVNDVPFSSHGFI